MTDDDLRLLRAFRVEVLEPNPETAERIYRLATAAPAGGRSTLVRPLALLAAALAVSAAVVLAFTSPWQGGPTILQRASAAISSPASNGVLYYEIYSRVIGGFSSPPPPTHIRVWLQEGGSHQFVSILAAVTCPNGTCLQLVTQIGGSLSAQQTLTRFEYDPARNLLHRAPLPRTAGPKPVDQFGYLGYDPLATIREALAAGTGHIVSKNAHTITIDVPIRDLHGVPGTATYIVNAKTYHPIQMTLPHVSGLALPFVPIFNPSTTSEAVITFQAYQYLPATAHNLALANIQARHPTAKITSAPDPASQYPAVGLRYCSRPTIVFVNGKCVKVTPSKAAP